MELLLLFSRALSRRGRAWVAAHPICKVKALARLPKFHGRSSRPLQVRTDYPVERPRPVNMSPDLYRHFQPGSDRRNRARAPGRRPPSRRPTYTARHMCDGRPDDHSRRNFGLKYGQHRLWRARETGAAPAKLRKTHGTQMHHSEMHLLLSWTSSDRT